MRRRLVASLIVCVALLTQLSASYWGAAMAREGYFGCHRSVSWAGGKTTPGPAPLEHDHQLCSVCQLGFAAVDGDAPLLPVRSIAHHRQERLPSLQGPPFLSVLNKSGPARAPPLRA